jgi:hypothetical protein
VSGTWESFPDDHGLQAQPRHSVTDRRLAEAELPVSLNLDAFEEREAMGRWIVNYLERQVSRPKGGLTGIDPRVSAF